MTTTDHADAPDEQVSMDTLVSLCKRRGFVFPASEIYGGFGSTYDYGPLGVELKRNIKDAWWRSMVRERSDIVGIDTAIIQSPRVWEASGHVQNFSDPMVDCRECKGRFRADHLEGPTCPTCGATGSFTEAREFNLMFRTHVGPVEDAAATAYLRPETAQGIFINFENVLGATRRRLPFGIAQQGKSFRNEITPGNFIFRTREFEQMEMEFFVDPAESNEWYERWIELREAWYHDLGISPENLRRDVHSPESLSHYSAGTTDLQYRFPWGWDELEGIANRTDFDLTQHGESSGKRLDYFDQAADKHVIPHVIEPAVGVDRIMLALLCDAYRVIPDEKGDARVVLALGAAHGAGHGRRTPAATRCRSRARGRPAPPPLDHPVRRHPEHRSPLPAPGRNRHPVVRDDRLRIPRRQRRPPPRHPKAGPPADRASERLRARLGF